MFVEGEDVTTLDGRELSRARQRMGFLFQHAALFDSLTVGETLASHYAAIAATCRTQRSAVSRWRSSIEVGLAADYTQDAGGALGRDAQRAGLARAMVLDPSVLLSNRARGWIRSPPPRSKPARRSEAPDGDDAAGRHP